MKSNLKFFLGFFLCMFLVAFATSCEKDGASKEVAEVSALTSKVEDLSKAQENCCTVTCRRGNCLVSSSPCSCTCIGGQPMCSSTGGNGRISLTSTPDMMASYDALAAFILDLGDSKVSDAVIGMKQLFVNNDYKLSSHNDVERYNAYLNLYAEFYNRQSTDIQDKMEDL